VSYVNEVPSHHLFLGLPKKYPGGRGSKPPGHVPVVELEQYPNGFSLQNILCGERDMVLWVDPRPLRIT
jgi:hypothetical protein